MSDHSPNPSLFIKAENFEDAVNKFQESAHGYYELPPSKYSGEELYYLFWHAGHVDWVRLHSKTEPFHC